MVNNNQGQQVTGDDSFDALLAQAVQTELAKQQATGTGVQEPAKAASAEIKVNIGGQEYVFPDQAALNTALNNMVAGYSNQMAQLQAQAQEQTGTGSQVTGDETPKFDMKQYVEYMEKDPIKAADYLDSHRYFNGRVDNPSSVIRDQLIRSAELERIVAAYQFKDAHPEYQPTPQNAQVIDQVRQALNLPANFEGLEAAYATAVSKGFLPDMRLEQLRQQMQQNGQGQQSQEQPYNPNYTNGYGHQNTMTRQAPPPLPQGGGFSPNMGVTLAQAEDLDMNQLAAILNNPAISGQFQR